jgi:hypothetical protein
MFSGYYYPYYRSFVYPMPMPMPWSYNTSNVIGSAVSNQDFVNTGTAVGVNQISTPTVIW